MLQFIQDLAFGRGPLLIELHQCQTIDFLLNKLKEYAYVLNNIFQHV